MVPGLENATTNGIDSHCCVGVHSSNLILHGLPLENLSFHIIPTNAIKTRRENENLIL